MAIDGITSVPFSARTIAPVSDPTDLTEEVVAATRQKYARPRAQVERDIAKAADMVSTQSSVTDFLSQANKKLEKTDNVVTQGDSKYRKVIDSDNERWFYGQPPKS